MLELEIYKGENLDVEAITFKDNQGCLDLIEAKKTGILAMIEEEIYVPRGSDDTLLEKLHGQHVSKSDFYKRPKMTGGGRGKDKERLPTNCFVVVHFAGEVSYSVTSFLEKCKDRLPPDAEAMVKASEKPLVQKLFAEEPTEQLTPRRGGRVPTLVRLSVCPPPLPSARFFLIVLAKPLTQVWGQYCRGDSSRSPSGSCTTR